MAAVMVQEKLIKSYDRSMSSKLYRLYYGASDYCNFGYWTPGITSQRDACAKLTTTLLDFIPDKSGTILDVACGMGATTRELLTYYEPANVSAINISSFQLRRAEQNAPGCTFRLMDATKLDFPDNIFDNMICVEAAFHFDTRNDFLEEAFRVLKPGGRLVMSDMIFKPIAHRSALPKGNYLKDMRAYHANLGSRGFAEDSQVVDVTKECWTLFAQYQKAWYPQMRKARMITAIEASTASFWMRLWRLSMRISLKNYVLVAAHKPA